MPYAVAAGRRLLAAVLLATPLVVVAAGGATAGTPITSCGTTQNVTPSTFASALSGGGCKILQLASGSYPTFTLDRRSGGVLTIRCATQGACRFGGGSRATSVDGLIIDNITVTGGEHGLFFRGSKNVKVTRSRFIKQAAFGLVSYGGTARNDNIQVYDNVFYNNTIDGYVGGYPRAYMDYGIGIYDTNNMEVIGNTFNTIFNHAISVKSGVVKTIIERNTFNDCGRICVHLGQSTPVSDQAFVRYNTFNNVRMTAVRVDNIKYVVMTGNTFVNTPRPISLGPGPSGRTVISSPNTYR
jgi:hypothetical protein